MSEEEKKSEAVEEEPEEEITTVEDIAIEEAEKDVESIGETSSDINVLEDEVIAEFYRFKRSCEALEELMRAYVPEIFEDENVLMKELDMRSAMKIAARMLGIGRNGDEELIPGEPSPYVQELAKKVMQRWIDCRWLKATMKGRKAVTPSELKFEKLPEELKTIRGEEV